MYATHAMEHIAVVIGIVITAVIDFFGPVRLTFSSIVALFFSDGSFAHYAQDRPWKQSKRCVDEEYEERPKVDPDGRGCWLASGD
ncbi:hypothetical protein BU23DRAFT_3015 [Bimuria novae-zelandiae CBS 107.79]|uniref:Uncharacterized protein n=1 Tax=Bimuria novae-zelandiae CBS 107.79 TaxID=1447943 RepID=A0A6A5VZ24_9PLEO|nr:hypothetical protein BU23DRAFT_3015 [Bimuria novae-zelandiae CBS 107.79]